MKSGSREQKINRAIKQRDSFRCYICGQVRLEHDLEVDHLVALCEGGPDTWSNRASVCRYPCHAEKSQAETQRARARAR